VELGRDSASDSSGAAPRRSMFRREAISIAELGVQTFAVVLGILLALAIDGWRKDRETRESVTAAMSAVHAELAANNAQITQTDARLHKLVDALGADEKTAAPEKPCNEYENWNGIGLPVLLDAAYQTTIATQAFAHTDFARAQTIAQAYGLQRLYIDERAHVVDLLLRAQPLPVGFCRGVVEELTMLNDNTEAAYAKALAVAAP
jgi:type II secretory pathway pseudopilin PulG